MENETAIQEALSRLIKDKTVLIIAHRMRMVSGADKIIVLKDGTVVEQGTPGPLSRRVAGNRGHAKFAREAASLREAPPSRSLPKSSWE